MITISKVGGIALLLAAATPALAQQGDAERGGTSAVVCVACHQADGMGMNIPGGESWPRLAGMNADYLAKQLHDFKSGDRENMTMMPFANMLSDQQIADVAAYYAEMASWPELPTAYHAADPNKEGEWLAERGDWEDSTFIPACNQCHGPNGQGVGTTFPPLAGQHAGYIKNQLNAWREGTRHNDPNELMVGIAKRLSDEQVELIAEYYAELPESLAAADAQEQQEDAK
ncbi:c-type cytochrome [Halomonas halocynthiae]|uniref:c-type cytochrome n=1 Tax=Halomonas halocynthiae TaxID=176290 RepID=UPI000403ED7C|nr:c-type cytochrome [Halomonas halocynthiae]